MCSLLEDSILLLRGIDVHVNYLVVHSAWDVGRVVAESRLEMKMIQKIAFEGGGVGKDHLLSASSSHASIYFTGHIDPVLDHVLGWSFLVIDFVHDFWV